MLFSLISRITAGLLSCRSFDTCCWKNYLLINCRAFWKGLVHQASHKLKSYGFSGQILGLVHSFVCNRLLCAMHYFGHLFWWFMVFLLSAASLSTLIDICYQAPNFIRFLGCSNSLSWLWDSNLTLKTLWIGVGCSLFQFW